jgi:hypothetical protein
MATTYNGALRFPFLRNDRQSRDLLRRGNVPEVSEEDELRSSVQVGARDQLERGNIFRSSGLPPGRGEMNFPARPGFQGSDRNYLTEDQANELDDQARRQVLVASRAQPTYGGLSAEEFYKKLNSGERMSPQSEQEEVRNYLNQPGLTEQERSRRYTAYQKEKESREMRREAMASRERIAEKNVEAEMAKNKGWSSSPHSDIYNRETGEVKRAERQGEDVNLSPEARLIRDADEFYAAGHKDAGDLLMAIVRKDGQVSLDWMQMSHLENAWRKAGWSADRQAQALTDLMTMGRAQAQSAGGGGEDKQGDGLLEVGDVEDGFRYRGGPPEDASSWERVR